MPASPPVAAPKAADLRPNPLAGKEECNEDDTHVCYWEAPDLRVCTKVRVWVRVRVKVGLGQPPLTLTLILTLTLTPTPTPTPTPSLTLTLTLTKDEPVDDHCPLGYTRSYTGVNCAGGAGSAWEAEHGDAGCEIEGRYRGGDVGEIEHGDAGCDSP